MRKVPALARAGEAHDVGGEGIVAIPALFYFCDFYTILSRMKLVGRFCQVFVFISSVFLFAFLLTDHAHAESAGAQKPVPDNYALIGIGYGSDDRRCTLYIKEGTLQPDGTIANISNWREFPCIYGGTNHWGDDPIPSQNRQKEAPTGSYVTGWTYDAPGTSGGKKLGSPPNEYFDDDHPADECYFQAYQRFDPVTKQLLETYDYGSSYDGSCRDRFYNKNELQQVFYANPGKVIVAVGLSLGDDGNVSFVSISIRKPPATIKGRVYDTATGQGFAGVKIDTCSQISQVTTDASGYFAFPMKQQDGFCLREVPNPYIIAGYTGPVLNQNPGYENQQSYEGQASSMNAGGQDRAVNDGYDFKYTKRPTVDLKANGQDSLMIDYNTPVTLSWTSQNATSCTAQQDWSGTKGPGGSQPMGNLKTNKTYKMYCIGPGGNSPTDTVLVTVRAPTLTADIAAATDVVNFANPFSGTEPLFGVDLRGTAGGTADGTINYTFYCNRSDDGTNITQPWDAKFDGITENPKIVPNTCAYDLPGTYIGKVIIERLGLAAQKKVPITVNAQTLTIDAFFATPPSGIELVNAKLTADVGGTAPGTINYSFWWVCSNPSTKVGDLNKPLGQGGCGILPTTCGANEYGYKCDNILDDPKETTMHTYAVLGTHTAKVIVERGRAPSAEARTTITVNPDTAPNPPTVTNSQPATFCGVTPSVTVNWVYNDPDNGAGGDLQSAYQVQIDNNSNFSSPEIDSGKKLAAGFSFSAQNLSYNTTYYVRVRTWDSYDKVSGWSATKNFPTTQHPWPQVDFSWTPAIPALNKLIPFTDKTVFSDGKAPNDPSHKWAWTFNCKINGANKECTTATSTIQNPSNTYYVAKNYPTTLKVTDAQLYACTSDPKNVPAGGAKQIPQWHEVAPQ